MKNVFKAVSLLMAVVLMLGAFSITAFAQEAVAQQKSNIEMFLETLPIMGIGMLGVFVVVGIIILLTMVLTKIFTKK